MYLKKNVVNSKVKKILVTILAFVYLATASGATLHMHYCMGKIYSVDFVKKEDCSKCGMQANDGCCTDEFKVIKVDDNHHLVSNDISLAPSFTTLLTNYNLTSPVFSDVAASSATPNNSPPPSGRTSLYILNRVFRL